MKKIDDSNRIVTTWEGIAKVTEYSANYLRQKFGPEMKKHGIVWKGSLPGKKSRRPTIWSYVWKIEKYFELKWSKGEL